MERKLTRLPNIIIMGFLFLFAFYNVEASAETQLPQNYGAKGALQDSSITLEKALTYAIQDEHLAQARYDTIIAKFGSIRPFAQIKSAEQRHISALLSLFEKYKIKVPEDNAKLYTKEPGSLKEAFQSGVVGEVDNIAMYNKLTSISDIPQDVKVVMKQLGEASQNHLVAFKRGLSQYQ
ncbi:ferritin-like domain-containing protein [Neobacillus niacini]|uniref:ferritin-like domain-containing protein n=1 Tax=Neobacillus niacini TaxID=86668 RepID=UPI00204188D3|nr:DUF2202 domain-containing protein [Neobacillus niacini]MCM3690176.1 DUF2202 domain-containing protein [Neobacillus niacini]